MAKSWSYHYKYEGNAFGKLEIAFNGKEDHDEKNIKGLLHRR
jgi:hypothetical protein